MAENYKAEVEAVMKKYDRESNTRVWEGRRRWAVGGLMAAFSLYCIGMTLFSTALPETRLSLFVGLLILLGFLTFPAKKGRVRVNFMPWYDIVLAVVGAGCFFYFAIFALPIIRLATRIEPIHVVIGCIGIGVLAELCRRCVGLPMLCVLGALLLYTFYNQMQYSGDLYQALHSIVYKLFYTTSGVIGTPINVCYTYIILFIIFGAFLERTGISNLFIDLANCVAGTSCGGSAKVAVIASAFEGMASGSSVANTVGSGSVTIPMMIKLGYRREFAAAVEASASTGGQIMPPIMGAAAFLMAEYLDLPYMQVAVKAILPAVLFFFGVFIAVHLEAKKSGLRGIPRSELPRLTPILKKSYLLLPLVLLIVLVAGNVRTMQFSASVSILAAVLVGLLNKDDRLTPKGIFEALEAGAKSAITVGAACGVAGMIAGCITVTGLASTLINGIVSVAADAKLLGLVLTMLCCIVLGMGVPTTANYCIMASTCAPILIQLGIAPVAAHFFVFYFGIVADITPPVALAAYAGAAIAKANPMKTGFTATKLAIAAFVVPFVFALHPEMLFVGTVSVWSVIQICITSMLGIFGIAGALEGYLLGKMPSVLRLISAAGGVLLLLPGTLTDVTGLILLGVTLFLQLYRKKRRKTP